MLGLGNLLTKSGVIKKFPNEYSFNFDGSNDYLLLDNESGGRDLLNNGASGSISVWVYAEALDQTSHSSNFQWRYPTIISKGNVHMSLIVTKDGAVLGFYYSSSASNVENIITANSIITTGNWHHIAWTWNASSSKLYVDGIERYSGSYTPYDMNSSGNNTDIYIGHNASSTGGNYAKWNGLIDELAIWRDIELSADDVAKIASKPVDLSKPSKYATDRTGNLKLWLRAGDKVLPENDTAIARQDFYTDFDGSDDDINAGRSDNLGTGTNFTISSWFKNLGTARAYMLQLQKGSGSTNLTLQVNGNSSVSTAGYIGMMLWDGANHQFVNYDGSIDDNKWHHVAVTTTSSAQVVYLDGKSVATGSNTFSNSFSEHPISIGSAYNASGFNYNGYLSNLAIYQTALDAQTISQMAKSRFTPMRDNRFSVVDFDGSNDYITLGNADIYPDDIDAEEFLITAWVNCSVGSDGTIFSKADNSNRAFQLFTNTDDTLSGYVGGTLLNSSTVVADGTWHHVALRSFNDGGTYKGEIYIDGVFKVVGTSGTTTATDRDFLIGARRDSSNTDAGYLLTNSSIASVAIYSEAKDAEFVYAQYQKGITYDESSLSGLVGYWRMGDDTSKAYPTIADSSSNSNDGTMTSMASDDIVQQMVAGYDLGAFESSSEELGGEIASDNFGGWTLNGWTDNGDGTASANNSSGGNQDLTIYYSFTEFIIYKMTATFSNISGTFYYNLDATGSLNKTITTNGEHILYVQAPSGGSGHFFIRSSNGSSATISNVSIKEVLQSEVSDTYPAIIDVANPILGVELVDTDAQTFEGTSTYGWAVYGSNTIANDSNTLKITREDHNQGAYLYLRDSTAFSTDLTVGSIYKMTADFLTTDSSLDYQVRVNGGGGSGDDVTYSGLTNTSFVTKSFIFKANHTQNAFLVVEDLSGSQVVKVDNMSLREIEGNVGTMTNQDSADLVYSSVLPDQSFLTGVNSAYNFISLDGSNEYIDAGTGIGNFLGDNYAGDLSISVWFKSAGFGNDGVFNIGNFSSTNGEILILIYNNELGFHLNNAGWRVKVTSFSDTSWNHLVCVYKSGSESDTNMYLNGSSVGSKSGTFPSASDIDLNGLKTIIGAYSSASTPFNGDMGQVAIWNKELSSTEVSAIYTAGRHSNLLDSYSDNLKGYWAMSALDAKTGLSDVGDGTIYDRSGNSNHGTATNTESADLKSSPNAEPEGYAKGDTNRSTTTP